MAIITDAQGRKEINSGKSKAINGNVMENIILRLLKKGTVLTASTQAFFTSSKVIMYIAFIN